MYEKNNVNVNDYTIIFKHVFLLHCWIINQALEKFKTKRSAKRKNILTTAAKKAFVPL